MEAATEKIKVSPQLNKTGADPTIKNNQMIVFKLGEEEYGLLIDQIKEVVITPHITRVPLTAGYIKGVANVRGNILAIVDLEERFGLSPKSGAVDNDSEKPNYTLVVESEDLKMGILVKEVPNTLAISQSQIDQSPNILNNQASDKNYIKGIVTIQNRLVILIDIYKVVNREEVSNTLSVIK